MVAGSNPFTPTERKRTFHDMYKKEKSIDKFINAVYAVVDAKSKPWSKPQNDECVIFLWYAIHFSYLLFVGVWRISCICGMNGEEANKTDIRAIYKSQEFEQFYNGPWIMMNDKWVVFFT